MPGLAEAVAIFRLLVDLPWLVVTFICGWAVIRRWRSGGWRGQPVLPAVIAGALGVSAGVASDVACGFSELDVLPCWTVPLDVAAVVAASLLLGGRALAKRSNGPRIGRWMGVTTAAALMAGMLVGVQVLPRAPIVGAVILEVRCRISPDCDTPSESAAAERVDGTATLRMDGEMAVSDSRTGAQCEFAQPEDGYQVRAVFDSITPAVTVTVAVQADGAYRLFQLQTGSFAADPYKGWDPTTSITVEAGSTPASGRMTFVDVVDSIDAARKVSGSIAWSCPGFGPTR